MAAKLGPAHDIQMSETHRHKIRNSNILNALVEHAEGTREMSSTQVTAGLGLLKKCLPDLASIELSGKDGGAIETKDVSLLEAARAVSFLMRSAVAKLEDKTDG